MELLLSIIVPVYNVEKYVRTCLESIFNQGMDDNCFEVIIVNDGTQDKSLEVIEDIVCEHNNIKVLNQTNQGVAIARNNGVLAARGEYVIMPDSDDLIVTNSLKPILDVAVKSKGDIIVADFLQMTNEEIYDISDRTPLQRREPLDIKEMSGRDLFLNYLSYNIASVWHMLFRRDFLINCGLKFLPGVYFEDLAFTPNCFLKAEKCVKINRFLNIYRRCPESLTISKFNNIKAESFCICVKKVWELNADIQNDSLLQIKLKNYIFQLFSVLICFISHSSMGLLERGVIVSNLRKDVANMHFVNGIKQRIVSFMFWKMPRLYIFMRSIYASLFENNIYPFLRRIKNR